MSLSISRFTTRPARSGVMMPDHKHCPTLEPSDSAFYLLAVQREGIETGRFVLEILFELFEHRGGLLAQHVGATLVAGS